MNSRSNWTALCGRAAGSGANARSKNALHAAGASGTWHAERLELSAEQRWDVRDWIGRCKRMRARDHSRDDAKAYTSTRLAVRAVVQRQAGSWRRRGSRASWCRPRGNRAV